MDILVAMILDSKSQLNIVEIFKCVSESQCNIIETSFRKTQTVKPMVPMNSLYLVISGKWHQLERFQTRFSKLGNQAQWVFLLHRAKLSTPSSYASAATTLLPYSAHIIAPDAPDVLESLLDFFGESQVPLYELDTMAYKAPVTYVAMLEISLSFLIPTKISIVNFREDLIIFCDEHNFEVSIEPRKI